MAATTRYRLIALVVLLAGALLLAWLREQRTPQSTPTPAALLADGVLRVGVDASFPPFARDLNGALEGFDVDLAHALADKLGVRAQFVVISFDALYDAVVTDRVDVVISALVVNPARTQEVRYTRPYFDNGMVLVSPAHDPIRETADLAGKTLAFEYGSEAETQARRWLRGIAEVVAMPYELPDYALDALRLGIAQSAVVENTTLRLYLRQHPTWQPAQLAVTKSEYAAAVRVDRLALWQALQDALNALFDDGTIDALLKKWL